VLASRFVFTFEGSAFTVPDRTPERGTRELEHELSMENREG
jgi:hypothetical protein